MGGDGLDLARLRTAVRGRMGMDAGRVSFVAETGSTNDDAKRGAAHGAHAGAIWVADAQVAGRGRHGRVWHSPPGDNLYLSILLRPSAPPAAVAPFALVVGLAVAEEIDLALGAQRARVKWPNDVWVDGRKVAGILAEAAIAGGRVASLVVGIGVNVHTEAFPEELSSIATSLALLGSERRDRAALAAGITARVVDAERTFLASGLGAFAPSLSERDALRGRRVRVEGVEGVADGIDDGGRLRVKTADEQIVAVVAGHVELVGG